MPYKFSDPLGLLSVTTGACGRLCQGSDGGSGGGLASDRDGGFVEDGPTPESETNTATQPGGPSPGPDPADPPPPTNGTFVSVSSYSYTAERTDANGATQVAINVTETITQQIGVPDAPIQMSVRVSATNGPDATYKLSDEKLSVVASNVASAILKAWKHDVDRSVALALAERETFYGVFGPRKDKEFNAGQYTSGLTGVRPCGAATEECRSTNLESSMLLWRQKEKEQKTTDVQTVAESYRGKGIEPAYAPDILRISQRIRKQSNETMRGSVYVKPGL